MIPANIKFKIQKSTIYIAFMQVLMEAPTQNSPQEDRLHAIKTQSLEQYDTKHFLHKE